MPSFDSQMRLAALLKYFHHGDFGLFKRAAELAGYLEASDSPFIAADVLLACQLTGFIEVESTEGERIWWAVIDQPINIRSLRPKVIPTVAHPPPHVPCYPLVSDKNGTPLIWGRNEFCAEPPKESCDFGPTLLTRLPRVAAIERQLTRIEQLGDDLGPEGAEWFSPEEATWKPTTLVLPPARVLLRVRKQYGPWMYVARIGESQRSILLTDQEWAFPIARNIFGWPLAHFFRIQENMTLVARAFRLPNLLLRFIFANAESVSIGPWLRVSGLHCEARDRLFTYLHEAACDVPRESTSRPIG